MYETSFPKDGCEPGQHVAPFAPAQDGELRAFDWGELCARIAATRDLRRIVISARRDGGFENFAAVSDASETGDEGSGKSDKPVPGQDEANGKRAVNPTVSTYRKARSGNDAVQDNTAYRPSGDGIALDGERKAP